MELFELWVGVQKRWRFIHDVGRDQHRACLRTLVPHVDVHPDSIAFRDYLVSTWVIHIRDRHKLWILELFVDVVQVLIPVEVDQLACRIH